MIEFLLLATSDAELDPDYVRLLMFAAGSALLLYVNYQARRGGAYCHTGWTKFSPRKFFSFDEAPLQTRFYLLMQFAGSLMMFYLAFLGIR